GDRARRRPGARRPRVALPHRRRAADEQRRRRAHGTRAGTALRRLLPPAPESDEVIERVGLAAKANTRVGKLSGGQRRRVDVALGIIGRPELLFLDEPTTGFDPEARRRFWDLIAGLAHDGTTIVLTSHYLDEIEALATRLAVIAKGRVVAEGEPATLGGRASAKARVSWLEDGVRRT